MYLRGLVPLEEVPLKTLSHKLAMLIALVTAQRSQTLKALAVNDMTVKDNCTVFVVRRRLKTSKPGSGPLQVVIPGLCPSDSTVCPRLHVFSGIQ